MNQLTGHIHTIRRVSRMANQRIEFWDGLWKESKTPFWHRQIVHCDLMDHFDLLTKNNDSARILVPLCGKAVDMKWMYDLGHSVVGVEGVEEPIVQFFTEQKLEYRKEMVGSSPCYSTEDGRLKIIYSDLFSIDPEACGKFDGVWDRGSLVAIYHEDRERYAELIKKLLKNDFSYLVLTVGYDETKFTGPPRSVPEDEIRRLFGDYCNIEIIKKVVEENDESYDLVSLLTRKTTST